VKKYQLAIAKEAIAFQDSKFFTELTSAVKEIREKNGEKKIDYGTGSMDPILDCIKKYTNITVVIANGEYSEIGPCTWIPPINMNHILVDNDLKEEYTQEILIVNQVYEIYNGLKENYFKGAVSLKDSKVTGFFAELETYLCMPKSWFNVGHFVDDDEVAAVILHEVGHIFTGFEYATRFVRTNQVLATLANTLDKAQDEESRSIIMGRVSNVCKLSSEDIKKIAKCKNLDEISIIVLDADVDRCIKELGGSVYDTTSAEQLADQFATRHGAGRQFVTVNSKYNKLYKEDSKFSFTQLGISAIVSLYVLELSILSFTGIGVIVMLYGFMNLIYNMPDTYGEERYDNLYARYDRVRMDLVARLKTINLPEKELKPILESIDVIAKHMGEHKDTLDIYSRIAYVLKPSFRSNRKLELLEKDIEKLGNNDLFISAAKLKTI